MAAIAGLVTADAAPLYAGGQCLPGMCKFTESGKKGRFADTDVDAAMLAKNDAAIAAGGTEGNLFAAQSLNRGELHGTGLQMKQTEASILQLLGRMRPHWKFRAPPELKVRIVGAHSFVPEAFADGTIVVPLGVLFQAENDDEVAWLLAHEFSHLALGHFAREAKRKKRNQATATAFQLLETGLEAQQVRFDTSGGKPRAYQVNDPKVQAQSESIFRRSRQMQVAMSLLGGFFSRSQEDQADVLGLDLMLAGGFSEEGAGEALDVLAREEESMAQLAKRLQGEIGDYTKRAAGTAVNQANGGGSLQSIGQMFLKSMGDNVLQIVVNAMYKNYTKGHRPAPKRKEGVLSYFGHAYKKPPIVEKSTKWLTAVRSTAEYKEAFVAVTATETALQKLDDALPVEAAREIRPALGTRYRDTPLVANASARIATSQGQFAEADRLYSAAEKLPSAMPRAAVVRTVVRKGQKAPKGRPVAVPVLPPIILSDDPYLEQTLEGFGNHVALLVRMKNYGKALAVIGEGKRRFKDDESFLPAYVAIYFFTKQEELMFASMHRCMDSDNPDLQQKCSNALLAPELQVKVAELSPADKAKLDFELARTRDKAARAGFWSQAVSAVTAKGKDDDDDDK